MESKAVTMDRYGDTSVLYESTIEVPDLKTNEVLVEVLGTSVSPFDIGLRNGDYRDRMPLDFPAVLGTDAVGKIVAKGSDVHDYELGQRVLGVVSNSKLGAYSEFAILDGNSITALPENVSLDQGTVTMVGVPAFLALFKNGELKKGQKVLIHGGAGGVGSVAIQLAKNAGAIVYTTANVLDKDRLLKLGADFVIDYHTDFREQVSDMDLVLDTVGGTVLKNSFEVVKPGGRLVTLVEHLDKTLVEKFPQVKAQFLSAQADNALNDLMTMIANGQIHVPIQKEFPLTFDGIVAAQNYLANNHVFGRIAILKK